MTELERELEAARALEVSNAARARELDASVSARPRLLFLGVFVILGTILSTAAYIEEQRTGEMMSMTEQLELDVSVLAILFVGLAVGRRRLLTNTYNRSVWALWIIAVVWILAADSFLAWRGIDAATATAIDFGLLAAVFAAGAATFSRGLGWVALIAAVSATISALVPSLSTLVATLWLIVMIAVLMEQARRSATK